MSAIDASIEVSIIVYTDRNVDTAFVSVDMSLSDRFRHYICL